MSILSISITSSAETKLPDVPKPHERPSVFYSAPVDFGDLLLDYDKKLRPNYGGQPIEVLVSLHVNTADWSKNVLRLEVIIYHKF